MKRKVKKNWIDAELIRIGGEAMNMFLNLLYFAVYSFIGWVMETTFASITQRKFINRGFLIGPLCQSMDSVQF